MSKEQFKIKQCHIFVFRNACPLTGGDLLDCFCFCFCLVYTPLAFFSFWAFVCFVIFKPLWPPPPFLPTEWIWFYFVFYIIHFHPPGTTHGIAQTSRITSRSRTRKHTHVSITLMRMCFMTCVRYGRGLLDKASLRFEKRLHFSINPRKTIDIFPSVFKPKWSPSYGDWCALGGGGWRWFILPLQLPQLSHSFSPVRSWPKLLINSQW